MNSRLALARVEHARLSPVRHAFSYPLYLYVVDLDELDRLEREQPLFAHRRRGRPAAIRPEAYLDKRPGTLREKVLRLVEEAGVRADLDQILLVTSARYFGRVFNPVSFYFGYRRDGPLAVVLAEVNNTFGDRHLYVIGEAERAAAPEGEGIRYTVTKAFHVSPFHPPGGRYEFRVADLRERLDIAVDLHRDGACVFRSRLRGDFVPWTRAAHRRLLLSFPLTPWLTVPRIAFQALRLRFGKGLAVFPRPAPSNRWTIGVRGPTRFERFCRDRLFALLGRTRHGALRLRLPDRTAAAFGETGDPAPADLDIRDWRFFRRAALSGGVGVGESYVAGEWDAPDVARVIATFIRNWSVYTDRQLLTARPGRALNRLRHARRTNTRAGSRRNISEHYDLPPEFFREFLDDSMTYSCALFGEPGDTLETAQARKRRALLAKARLGPGHRVLEIGCGWGSLALEAARAADCRVTALTVSESQRRHTEARVRAEGLSDRVEVRLEDYRDAGGLYDAILSVEMLEAVGHENFGAFFAACDRLLAPDGLVVLQVITLPDWRYDGYRRTSDWIQKHIFPGGLLPSLTALADAMTARSRLLIEHVENIGPHYARTLREWRRRFDEHEDRIAALGYDAAFRRKWRYYLAYCEAGFATRTVNDLQIVITRQGNPRLPGAPG